MLRYPGGCFSSWYHWRDGVGPTRDRPRYERQFWTQLSSRLGPPEPNLFGTDEFLQFCVDVNRHAGG